MPSLKAFFVLALVVLVLNAFKLTSENPLNSILKGCPTQAASCDTACSDLLQSCLGQCLDNYCATSCVSGNVAADNVWGCVMKEGKSPLGGHESINKPVTINWGNLQEFKNFTGSSFGQKQLDNLINFINSASAFYGAATQKVLQYIKTSMDDNFGDANNKYGVIMQLSQPIRSLGQATIYCINGTNYAQIGYGTDRIFPAATYLVYKISVFPNNSYIYKDYNYGIGDGLTNAQGDQINYLILEVDGTDVCDCLRTHDISQKLQHVIDRKWNVVCQSIQNIWSEALISNNQWILTKPVTCIYFIYAVNF